MAYQIVKKEQLIYVRSSREDNPIKSKAEFVFAAEDLSQIQEILCKGGTTNSYKYNFSFNGRVLSIHYLSNRQIFKKIQITDLDNLIGVISKATGRKKSPIKGWLKKWLYSDATVQRESRFKHWLKEWLQTKEAPMT